MNGGQNWGYFHFPRIFTPHMLTDTKIRGIRPAEKKFKVHDRDGLYLLVMPSGTKTWRFRYRFGDARPEMSLGKYPAVSLKDAREKVFELRKMLENGIDPQQAHRRTRLAQKGDGYTVAAAIDDFLADKAAHVGEVHLAKCRSRFNNHVLPGFGSRELSSVETDEYRALLASINNLGKNHMARRVQGLLNELYSYAILNGHATYNPVQPLAGIIKPKKVKNHARITNPQRFGELLRAIDHYRGAWQVVLALKFLPLVFVRQKELRFMDWADVDLERKLWTIPATKIKMARDHLVPLSRQAIEILRDAQSIGGDKGLVFPGMKNGRPLSENAVRSALLAMGFSSDEMTGHGFRGTASTLLNELGYDSRYIDMQLAHWDSNSVSAAYNHALYLKQRTELMQEWADYLDKLRAERTVC